MLKIRRSCDRLIFNMGIPIPGKDVLYIDNGPGLCANGAAHVIFGFHYNTVQHNMLYKAPQ